MTGESWWILTVHGTRCENVPTLLFSEAAFIDSMVVRVTMFP